MPYVCQTCQNDLWVNNDGEKDDKKDGVETKS